MRVVVVGTGTGVGKTYVSCALARWLAGEGRGCRALKPVESGLVGGVAEDAAALAHAAGHEFVAPVYAFERPVSPHLEARRMGVVVTRSEVVGWVRRYGGDVTLVETAGGLLSPLTDDGVTNLDVLRWLEADRVVVVASDRLGVLHDVSVVKRVLVAEGFWDRVRVVLTVGGLKDRSTGTNAAELVELGVVERVATVGRDGGVAGKDGVWVFGWGVSGAVAGFT